MDYHDGRFPYNNLEHLVTTEMRYKTKRQGFIRKLYEIERGAGNPITYDIAQALKALGPARVAIVTGIVFPPYLPKGEVDGTVGAAVLARGLERLGNSVDILVEKEMDGVMGALVKRFGLKGKLVFTSDRSSEEVRGWSAQYDVAVTIEKLGRNAEGIRHSTGATPLQPGDSYIDDFILALNEQGKLTIGIGDGGNEIGFGKIHEQVRSLIALGDKIATVTPTRYLLPAAVSNYGAYCLTGALALASGDTEVMVSGAQVAQGIRDVIAAGAIDGGTADPNFLGDDGIPLATVEKMVDLLGAIISQWNIDFVRKF